MHCGNWRINQQEQGTHCRVRGIGIAASRFTRLSAAAKSDSSGVENQDPIEESINPTSSPLGRQKINWRNPC
jgi:hypothetical protein